MKALTNQLLSSIDFFLSFNANSDRQLPETNNYQKVPPTMQEEKSLKDHQCRDKINVYHCRRYSVVDFKYTFQQNSTKRNLRPQ